MQWLFTTIKMQPPELLDEIHSKAKSEAYVVKAMKTKSHKTRKHNLKIMAELKSNIFFISVHGIH